MVFTHYHHLAATARRVRRGARIGAGEVIGLLGDTGLREGERRHLHFALSVRPSSELAEAYWDPAPLMTAWRLRVPPNGTVAGLAPSEAPRNLARRRRGR
jgi:murein DD-endopeptidase MepM/ murein hydrolase activator NlpD